MFNLIKKAREFLVRVNDALPEFLRIIESDTIRNLSETVITIAVAVLVISSISAAAVPQMDSDGDGLSNGTEWLPYNEVNWLAEDTDSDGVSDDTELYSSVYNASDPDTDGDELNDLREHELGTNASRVDTDGDGIRDPIEIGQQTDPTQKDTDRDSLPDPVEQAGNTSPTEADTDYDGLTDGQERAIGSSPTENDTDSDLVLDQREYELNTSLTNWDTDGDTLSDLREIISNRLNPRRNDTDQDGLNDTQEVKMATLANVSDTDEDGLIDGFELQNKTSPITPDSDNDSLLDGTEVIRHGSNPLNPDTDFDNITDTVEVRYAVLNATSADIDGDGLEDGTEWYGETNTTLVDTDDDGLDDWNETKSLPTDPTDNDTDSDGLLDGNETTQFETEPLNPDTDSDELEDGVEKRKYGTNPIHPDTDKDALSDAEEVNKFGSDPTKSDTDGDHVSDGREIRIFETNPVNSDTDRDGIPDGTEVKVERYNPLESNPLKSKSPDLSITNSQKSQLGALIDVFVRLAHSVARDNPKAGVLREYSQAITELPDADFTGSKATIISKFKQAGLYQILDLIEAEIGPNLPTKALKGRLTQAIEIGARMSSVLAVVTDYSTLHDQAEKLVRATGENVTAAKIGVISATAVLLIDAYLLYQTGGTFTIASGQKLAFALTGQIAAKTKLARLAKYCSWKCVGGVERLIHWALRSAITIGETQLINSLINIGYSDATEIELVDILRGMSAQQISRMITLVEDVVDAELLEVLKEAAEKVSTERISDTLSNRQMPGSKIYRTSRN